MAKAKRDKADGQTHHPPKSIEQQSEDSFPASDPPSFSGGNHIIGAPIARKSKAAKPHSAPVREAEAKVKSGQAKKPNVY
ncbi:MAG: hypothetical protein JOZ55_03105 [Alphaproteobacteria bacterium]|nr:hypothetical protein [Alphaproteobacteria bacterium]